MNIQFDLRSEGEALTGAFLDEMELEQMFESTRRSLGEGLRRKFRDVVCAEHEQAPSFLIRGIYDKQLEEMDIQYHVDACCRYFLLRVMQILNQQG